MSKAPGHRTADDLELAKQTSAEAMLGGGDDNGDMRDSEGPPMPDFARKPDPTTLRAEQVQVALDDAGGTVEEFEIPGTPYFKMFSLGELQVPQFYKACFAELLATAFFNIFSMLIVTSATGGLFTGLGTITIWIIVFHVILVILLIFTFANLSGGHFNPTVTVAVMATRRMTLLRGVCYIIFQYIGGLVGTACVMAIYPKTLEDSSDFHICNHHNPFDTIPSTNFGEIWASEMVLAFCLIFFAFALAFDPRGWGPMGGVGIAVAISLVFFSSVTAGGACLNGAVAFGRAALANDWSGMWVWVFAAPFGSVLAALCYEHIFMFRKLHAPKVPATAGHAHEIHSKFDHVHVEGKPVDYNENVNFHRRRARTVV